MTSPRYLTQPVKSNVWGRRELAQGTWHSLLNPVHEGDGSSRVSDTASQIPCLRKKRTSAGYLTQPVESCACRSRRWHGAQGPSFAGTACCHGCLVCRCWCGPGTACKTPRLQDLVHEETWRVGAWVLTSHQLHRPTSRWGTRKTNVPMPQI